MGIAAIVFSAVFSSVCVFAQEKLSSDYLPTQSKLNEVEYTPVDEIRANFAQPGVDYATAPLWVWNDLLTEEQVRSTLKDLNEQRVNMAFVHPRPGLATPYLTDEWFRLWSAALDEAKSRGMKVWIYDENSYPSGFAGGYVPDAMPESRGSGLNVVFYDSLVDQKGAWQAGDAPAYVVEALKDGSTKDRTAEILAALQNKTAIPAKTEDDSRWIVGRVQLAGSSQWFGGKTYVNLMTKGVLDKFIEFTHEAYRKNLGDQFGKLIPGAFTDEPQVASAGMFSWTADFPEEFQKRRGYDIVPCIGSLVEPIGDWKHVRYDYFKTVLEVFVDRWHKPLAEYCENVGLEYTGHDWEHDWPNAHMCPDNMATAFWRQRPAIDLLMNNFSRGTHAQFGNVRSVRELNSITRQAGRARSISENYGAGGYDIKFEDLKRLGDWSYALGVNTTCEHLSYISIRGARKHDHPQTFSYHSPWFEQYSKLEDYWTRLSYLLSRGELSQDRFLLIEPTSTAWMYQQNSGPENNGKKDRLGNTFANLLDRLEAAQVDYDLGSEDVIRRIGNVKDGIFTVGAASYKTVVLSGETENLDAQTVQFLSDFVRSGGRVLSLGAPLNAVDGIDEAALSGSAKDSLTIVKENLVSVTFEELLTESKKNQPASVNVVENETNVFHQIRETKDGLILFLCNIDLENPASGTIVLRDAWDSVEEYDATTGAVKPWKSVHPGDPISYSLKPCNSLSLVFSHSKSKESSSPLEDATVLDPWKIADSLAGVKPCDDNVLVLDYMTVNLKNESLKDAYFYRANMWFWNQKGYPLSPWDNGVQFKDELITRKFDDESPFEVIYHFEKNADEIDDLRFVVESPDMFTVYCNGKKIERIPNAWKFDRAFGVFDIAKAVQPGKNEIKLIAEKATIFCELMPAWIVGSFSLEPANQGFIITHDKGLTFTVGNSKKQIKRASSDREHVSWLSSGVNFSQQNDRAPALEFSFGDSAVIDSICVWNYCELNLESRGVKTFEMDVLDANGKSKKLEGYPKTIELNKGAGLSQTIKLAQQLELAANERIKFTVSSNWNGIQYPLPESFVGTTKADNDNAFVGLAEVQFLNADGNSVPVDVAATSELIFRMHERRAQFLIDGSGLETIREGWAAQGRPFYAGAVDYQFDLDVAKLAAEKRVLFELSQHELWSGAVAAILIDDEQIGAVGWSGDSVDLTSHIHAAADKNVGSIKLTVRVYGTPKNLFGPHHAGKVRGSAWPGSFHGAPEKQPSGDQYDVIEYGLFGN